MARAVHEQRNPQNPAELWLSWSADAREKYIWGYVEGFGEGKRGACTYYADKITPTLPHEPLPPEKLPRSACINDLPSYPQYLDTYSETVTAYYKKYPHDRQAGISRILEELASPPGLSIDEIHAKLTQ